MAAISSLGLSKIKHDLRVSLEGCSERGLSQSRKWATELCCALSSVVEETVPQELPHVPHPEWDQYLQAKCYFDLREYDRAAHFAANISVPQAKFLHWYARYLSGEKKKLDDAVDPIAPTEKARNPCLRTLRAELQREHLNKNLDGYCLYLYGVVLKRLQLQSEALTVLLEAIQAEPCHWGSWMELAALITDKEMGALCKALRQNSKSGSGAAFGLNVGCRGKLNYVYL